MTDEPRPHVLKYTAGLSGFGRDTSPRWHCVCGGWSHAAHVMPHRLTGDNEIEARRAYRWHVAAAPPKELT